MPHKDPSQDGKEKWLEMAEQTTRSQEQPPGRQHSPGGMISHVIAAKGHMVSMQVVGGHTSIGENATIKLDQQAMDKWLTASWIQPAFLMPSPSLYPLLPKLNRTPLLKAPIFKLYQLYGICCL